MLYGIRVCSCPWFSRSEGSSRLAVSSRLAICFRPSGLAGGKSFFLLGILYEPVTGQILYEKDAYVPRAMASTTKIMTALLAVENCSAEQEITVTKQAVTVEGSSLGLREGDQITMGDLVTGSFAGIG